MPDDRKKDGNSIGKKFTNEGAILAKIFIDTNIFIYAVDGRDAQKQLKAAKIIKRCIANDLGCISMQILQEFASVALLKLKQPEAEIIRGLNYLESLEVVSISPAIIHRGVQMTGEFQLHFWDATILAAAEHAGCEVLYSENFQAGETYGSVRAENPLL
jgi:predicted nucleic acid-binding protein